VTAPDVREGKERDLLHGMGITQHKPGQTTSNPSPTSHADGILAGNGAHLRQNNVQGACDMRSAKCVSGLSAMDNLRG
jgi:predicted molibdopterin-dependent oxidoreductase YjgC